MVRGSPLKKKMMSSPPFLNDVRPEPLPHSRAAPAGESTAHITAIMEGWPIGRRISLREHYNYEGLSTTLRHMFEFMIPAEQRYWIRPGCHPPCNSLNALPGHVIAYEDADGDLMLAGDIPWEHFVTTAKRIKIVQTSQYFGRGPGYP
ncbi:Aux/IAA family protein [Chara braunii]|uniref:Auxin-responsive protein n=1 Tax=Chara braunii TaxID=69332 RepID=A0A388LS14_CHABU|nr:Aux/IAA family protein [Chara braunii]|eukprot:GBG85126.1 Aux/IAA family protein [Chara braunii]